MKTTWKLIPRSYQIADTGDYDGHYEITNGDISIITQDDNEEELQTIVEALNNSGCNFYSHNDDKEWLEHENKLLKEELKQLRNNTTIPTYTIKAEDVEDCIMQSAFQLDNGKKIIVTTSCWTGIESYECNEDWKPHTKPFATCPRENIEGSLKDYHKKIREMHGPDKLVIKRSTIF